MDAVSEVKSRLSVEDVIGEYVRLKRTGKNYKGLSPFTNEKTPSFVVSPEKQIWHDFSSGRGGDMFTFVQEVEGLDFKGTLELLARKAGVDLDQYRSEKSGPKLDKERLYKLLELAAKAYHKHLLDNKKEAWQYLNKKRGFTLETIKDFQLGYSPDQAGSLTDALLKKGYKASELKLVGLSVERRGRLGDMFRGRIMIPLHDSFGRVIGFTARLVKDTANAPKYINTPATPLYDKSRHVFGLHLAKEAIRAHKYSVVVEGNMDVIASHQAGEKQVVATAGTALTEHQLKTLGRFSPDVRLAFDADRAGLEAAERSIPIASKAKVDLGIITLSAGKDPDELIRKDRAAWKSALQNYEYAMDWLINRYCAKLKVDSAKGKREFSDIFVPLLRELTDPVEKDHYLTVIAEILKVDIKALRSKLGPQSFLKPQKRLKSVKPDSSKQTNVEKNKAADRLLGLAMMLPGTRGYLELIKPEYLDKSEQKLVVKFLNENPVFDGRLSDDSPLREVGDYAKILSLQFEELYGETDTLELQYEAARLRARIIEEYVKDQKNQLVGQIETAPEKEQRQLLEQVKGLDRLLSKVKNTF